MEQMEWRMLKMDLRMLHSDGKFRKMKLPVR
jgi:hypothetical protein